MKNLQDLQFKKDEVLKKINEIGLISEWKRTKEQKSEGKKLLSEYQFLNTVVIYLSSNPSEDFIKKESVRIKTKLDLIESGFEAWFKQDNENSYTKARSFYNKEMNISTLKAQLNTLEFILS